MTKHRQPSFMTGFSLLLPITLSTMAIVLLAPILPQLLQEFSDVPNYEYWVPMILTVPALCVAIFAPVAGMAGDYFGRRKLLMVSFILYAAMGIAPIFLESLTAIIISRIGVGISEALIMVLTTTMIGDYFFGPARDRWLAAQTAFASVSALIFFNLGGQMGAFGWRAPFWVYLSALAMLALVAIYTWEPSQKEPSEDADKPPHNASWAGFPWAPLLGIMAITVYGSIFFYTVQIQASVGLAGLGETNPARIGFLTSVASIGVPLGTLIYSRVGRWPVKRLLAIEFGLLAIGFFAMGSAQESTQFLIGCFVNQLGAGMLLPTLLVWAMSLLPFEIRSRGSGMWIGAFSVGQFLSPLVITFVGRLVGGLMDALLFLSGAAVLGAAVAALSHFHRGPGGSLAVSANG